MAGSAITCSSRRRSSRRASRSKRSSRDFRMPSTARFRSSARRRPDRHAPEPTNIDRTMNKRLPDFDIATASEEQKAVLQDILSGPRGNLNGPFLGWIFSPELAQNAQQLGAFCRYKTGLPLRLSELAILVTAARWRSQ